uniref:chromosome transmission fidelity protein 18 homolog n=1 Tax=Erigeron canadensis TaxID=72917 RepID=UPI001CB95237|nr:chromosome transmission fidelity protein 18 homolog [Erigeron canadensis]
MDELDWLEADLHLHDDYIDELDLDIDIEPPPIEEIPTEEPIPLIKPTLQIPNNQNIVSEPEKPQSKKRLNPNPSTSVVEDKRCKIVDVIDDDHDEDDWMRFDPPKRDEAVNDVEVVEEEEKERFISRYVKDIDGDFMPVTGTDGDRVYAKLVKVDNDDNLKKLDLKSYSKGLMMEDINVLMEKVEQDVLQKALQASVPSQTETNNLDTPVATERLWVEKYSPNSFMELLSDEHTNREVLLWLKQWDSSVFGSELKSTTDDVLSALKRHSSVSQQKKVPSKSSFGWKKEFISNSETYGEHNHFDKDKYDSHGTQELHNKKSKDSGPPEQKILLLCGAPGLGKTTLAHVAAKHCGYRVVEINASDDRSSSSIETKILDVVQMNSVIADSRPKCLVIDEIDGALGDGKGAVDVILKMVKGFTLVSLVFLKNSLRQVTWLSAILVHIYDKPQITLNINFMTSSSESSWHKASYWFPTTMSGAEVGMES